MHFTAAIQLATALFLLLINISAHAVYKCASLESGILYSDIPCDPTAEKLQQQPALQVQKKKQNYTVYKIYVNYVSVRTHKFCICNSAVLRLSVSDVRL